MNRARSARGHAVAGVVIVGAVLLVGFGLRPMATRAADSSRATGAASVDSTPLYDLSVPVPADEPSQPRPPLQPFERTRAGLAAEREAARRNAKEPWGWEVLARHALVEAPSGRTPFAEDPKEIVEAIREAGKHLSAPALAALAAHGRHPELSRAYVKALAAQPPRGTSVAAEIAAEARDAVARFGVRRARPVLDAVRGDAVAVDAAGGTQNSVFRVAVLHALDSAEDQGFRPGFNAGVARALAGWEVEMPSSESRATRVDPTTKFVVRDFLVREEAGWTAAGIDAALETRPGIVVVASGDELVPTAAAATRAAGAIFVDARGPSAEDRRSWGSDFDHWMRPGAPEPYLGTPFAFDASLRYTAKVPAPRTPWLTRAFTVRPPGTERARRLGEVLRARVPQGDLAVALPRDGGDRSLVRGLEVVSHLLGRRLHLLVYEPGRRDYAPEARRFVESGAKALVLAGPAEESAEWALALGRARVKTLLLGPAELDPAGFHPAAKTAIEGAVFVADEWEERDSTLTPGASASAEEGESRQRGFRLGYRIGREVRSGAYTPASLTLALAAQSLPVHRPDPWDPLALSAAPDGATGKPSLAIVPLSEVRKGEAVRLEIR